MDVGDAYAAAWDRLSEQSPVYTDIASWRADPSMAAAVEKTAALIGGAARVPDDLLGDLELPEVLGVAVALDRLMIGATGYPLGRADYAAKHLLSRYLREGRLNEDPSLGLVLPWRVGASRPNAGPSGLNAFLQTRRVTAATSARVHLVRIPEEFDLPPARGRPLAVTSVPLLTQLADLQIQSTALAMDPDHHIYIVGPDPRVLARVGPAEVALRGADLALLPESTQNDQMLEEWLRVLTRRRRSTTTRPSPAPCRGGRRARPTPA